MLQNSTLASDTSIWTSLAEWYQGSLICEILTYLEDTYFSISFDSYQNFSLTSSTGVTIRNVILGIAIGIIIASAMIVHTKCHTGKFVRKLLRENCTSPEQAKTLLELGYFKNPSIRRMLKSGVTLGKLVHCKELEEPSGEESFTDETQKKKPLAIDFSTMHFYIPEELRYRAEIRFEEKGSSWLSFAFVLILTVVISSLLCVFMPNLFGFADGLMTLLAA